MDMTHVSTSVCHSAIRDTRSHRGKAPGRGCTGQDTACSRDGTPGKLLWEMFGHCKCSQHLKKIIQKKGVIFGRVEEAGKPLAALHSPGAGPWWQLEQQTSLDCCRAAQRSWPGTLPGPMDIIHRAMAEGQTGHLVLEMNKQANKKLGSEFQILSTSVLATAITHNGDFLVGLREVDLVGVWQRKRRQWRKRRSTCCPLPSAAPLEAAVPRVLSES